MGTAKRPVPDTAALRSQHLAGAAARLTGQDPAAALLDRAALLTLWRRAGIMPHTGLAAGEPAPAEARPRVHDAAARRLAGLLSDRADLLPQWLELCAAGGWRVPEELLPVLFERARIDRAVAGRFAAVIGERGAWLAAQNPAWQGVLDRASVAPEAVDVDVWETGRLNERVAYLSAYRRRDPTAARELLADAWASEGPTARAALIPFLDHGLSGADEPFLESALDDRRKEVREAAERLLCRLPGSVYAARMRERLLACITVRPTVVRRAPRIEVRPPATHDPSMDRDGIAAKPPVRSGETAREMWVRAIVARTRLSVWSELIGLQPERIVELPIEEYDAAVLAGWREAAIRQRNAEWARALAATWESEPQRSPGDLGPLLELLDPAERSELAARALRRPATADVRWIDVCPGPWDDRLGRAVLDVIREQGRRRPHAVYAVRAAVAHRLPAQLVPDLETVADQLPTSLAIPLRRMADDIRFRHEMAQELT